MKLKANILSRELFSQYAMVLRSAGGSDFYKLLIELIAGMINCDRWLVVRYPRYAPPELIVNNALTEEALAYYHAGLYQVDPLFHITRSSDQDDVIVLSRLEDSEAYLTYIEKLFDTAGIFDEIAILLGGPGKVCVALTLDRSKSEFTDDEILLIEMMLPFISELHNTHINRVFSKAVQSNADFLESENKGAVLLLDKNGKEVFRSVAWEEIEGSISFSLSEKMDKTIGCGAVPIGDDYILHWEGVGESFAVAPGGTLCVVEQKDATGTGYNFDSMLEQFSARHDITPREKDIIQLVLKGYPNSLIANKLKVSTGTIRNHRHRLYYKLDITTERELFSMFLDETIRA